MKGDAHKPPRDIVVAVRLSAGEHAAWKNAAALDGRAQLGRWVRERIDASLTASSTSGKVRKQTATPSATSRQLEVLAGQVAKIGTNLNQAVKALNTLAAKDVVPTFQTSRAILETKQALADVRELLPKIWAATETEGEAS